MLLLFYPTLKKRYTESACAHSIDLCELNYIIKHLLTGKKESRGKNIYNRYQQTPQKANIGSVS